MLILPKNKIEKSIHKVKIGITFKKTYNFCNSSISKTQVDKSFEGVLSLQRLTSTQNILVRLNQHGRFLT